MGQNIEPWTLGMKLNGGLCGPKQYTFINENYFYDPWWVEMGF